MPETALRPADDPRALGAATDLLRAGQIVAVPTETVYGLAADATNGDAVLRIYAAKGRPSFNPLIVHVADLAMAERVARFDAPARLLAEAFWPGPVTLVLPRAPDCPIADPATAGLPTVAVRVPDAPAMRALITALGRPLAAPSANPSGRISPTEAAHVVDGLNGLVPLVLDGGPTTHGLESTIVRPLPDRIELLRPGPVTADAIAGATGLPVVRSGGGAIVAPGQLAAHYAPAKPLRLDALEAEPDEWLIGFGAIAGRSTLSASGSLAEASACLFARLREADGSSAARIAVAPIPTGGLGDAICDRLARAAVGSGTPD